MNIYIITQNAPIYLSKFLDDFFYRFNKTSHKIGGITVLSPIFRKNIAAELIDRYKFYGFIDFIKMTILIVVNKLLSLTFHLFLSNCYSVSNTIKKHKLNQFKIRSINSKKFINYIKSNQIDLIISIASTQIFKNELLKAPTNGCINYHTGLLPRYRGRQPLFWALLNEEEEIGISIHQMDKKIDSGPIIIQDTIHINSTDTLHSLYLKTIAIGPTLLIEAINQVKNNTKDRLINDPNKATYYSFPTREDIKLFKKKGKRFF